MKRAGENTKSDCNNKIIYWSGCIVIIAIYMMIAYFTTIVSHSQDMLVIGDFRAHVSSFTGVVASVANLCFIALVVFYGKIGFFVTLIISLMQIMRLLYGIFFEKNMNVIPGIATTFILILSVTLIYNRNRQIEILKNSEIEFLNEQKNAQKRVFEQVSKALVSAVDAKDEYTNGHSLRVAAYSERIARLMGKTENQCYKVYYAALLHDEGKIGIDDGIIKKKGKLTEEEYSAIKEHPEKGGRILMSVKDYPVLSLGARYHHERYDGMGYPEGLKGEEIPEVARIIAVADAYDAMTSNRSYRSIMPQKKVREEFVKNSGTQFDPKIVEIMLSLIDQDVYFDMREKDVSERRA